MRIFFGGTLVVTLFGADVAQHSAALIRQCACAGVCWNKKNKRWQAAINSGGKYLYLGSYDSEGELMRAC